MRTLRDGPALRLEPGSKEGGARGVLDDEPAGLDGLDAPHHVAAGVRRALAKRPAARSARITSSNSVWHFTITTMSIDVTPRR